MLINILLLIISLSEFFLGTLIFLKKRRSKTNLFFGLTVYCVSAWVFAGLISRLTEGASIVFWFKIQYIIGALIAAGFLFFSYIFPSGKFNINLIKRILILGFLIFVLFLISWPGTFIKEIKIYPNYYREVFFKPISYLIYSFFIAFYFALSFYNLFKTYLKQKEKLIRIQLNYILVGTGYSVANGLIFDIILPWFGYFYFWIGTSSSLALVAFISYAILKKGLFGIKVILTEILVGVITILLLIQVLVSKNSFEYAWKAILFLVFLIFGYFLIRSVLQEVRHREEVEKLAQELEKANVKLKELDKAKSEFVSIASHQLRTPVTAIKGYSSMLLEGSFGEISEKAKKAVTKIFESSNRLVMMIADFLTLSRIERGKLEYNFQKINFKELVTDVMDEFNAMNIKKNKKLALSLKIEEEKKEDYTLNIDSDKIHQAVYNIIENAMKYTSKGFIKVFLYKTSDKNYAVLKVQDSGIGMNKEFLDKIFQKFTQASENIKINISGLGLGLYVAKQITEAHKGEIWAESEGMGKGSSFYVKLPAKFI